MDTRSEEARPLIQCLRRFFVRRRFGKICKAKTIEAGDVDVISIEEEGRGHARRQRIIDVSWIGEEGY